MSETVELLGAIVRLQVQREPLTVGGSYRPEPILPVDRGVVGPPGMIGFHNGAWIIDAHHQAHPRSRAGGRRALSVGFTWHYTLMDARYGRAPDGVAGENVIVATDRRVRLGDIAAGLLVRTAGGDSFELRAPRVAAPCAEFTSFMLGLDRVAAREELAEDLAFLGDGMRGYIVSVDHLEGAKRLAVGDEVFRYVT